MPTLRERLDADLKDAMRAKDPVRLDTIRNVRGAVKAREIDGGTELTDDAVMQLIRSLVKQRADSIEQYTAGGRTDLVAKEAEEKAVLESYLPAAVDPGEITRVVGVVVSELGASNPKDMGRVMKEALARLGANADGKLVSAAVKAALAGGA
jgi:uncharacterized protein YqeY